MQIFGALVTKKITLNFKPKIKGSKLILARKKASVNCEDDFIEQELKRKSAKTDVIQSDIST
ncbi:TPA: DUF5384 family protein [Haemophilus influenzae]|uniref:DUF5384 family protein n=1 Tax=Haemophilus influenzae TaxID=727 RepID=UPI000E56EEB2|nr:DUF5384 family protein [Haemophilus influenzae]MCK9153262.1 DUF5384 family protein [Haemophilus influenzae]